MPGAALSARTGEILLCARAEGDAGGDFPCERALFLGDALRRGEEWAEIEEGALRNYESNIIVRKKEPRLRFLFLKVREDFLKNMDEGYQLESFRYIINLLH